MPTTFNFPIMYETLDLNGDDFVVTLSDGTFTRPVCAFLDPANEGNEILLEFKIDENDMFYKMKYS